MYILACLFLALLHVLNGNNKKAIDTTHHPPQYFVLTPLSASTCCFTQLIVHNQSFAVYIES